MDNEEPTKEELTEAATAALSRFVMVAFEDNYSITRQGLDECFSLLVHLITGGTIYDYPHSTHEESVAMLSILWADTQRLREINDELEELNNDVSDEG